MISQCVWKNKKIKYVAGKIMVRCYPGVDKQKALSIIQECGGKIDCIHDYGIDVKVDTNETVNIAKKLNDYKDVFSFVSPEIVF